LLRKLLPQAIEADTFAIISSSPSSDSLSACLQVFQETKIDNPTHDQLASPKGRVIAVVDRTADLALAAQQLVTARFAFSGTSPYAPDLVLVNEFVKRDFLEHCLKHSLPYLSGTSDIHSASSPRPASQKSSRTAETLKTLQSTRSLSLKVITSGDNGAILDLSHLSALPPPVSQPLLCISSITSLEHAISLLDASHAPFAAAYHFGAPAAGKYLAQFIPAHASFINHMPYRLLLGPAAPAFHPIDVDARYAAHHFVRPAPAYIVPPKSQGQMENMLGREGRKAAAEGLASASREIREAKRGESIAVGYFEQGIFIGLGVYGVPLLTCIGASVFFGIRAGLRRWVFV
jgi:aldehyde dehydrogenase (NAD+)